MCLCAFVLTDACRDGPLPFDPHLRILNPRSLFCLWLVSVFYSFSMKPQPLLQKKKEEEEETEEAFCGRRRPFRAHVSCPTLRSSGTCAAGTWTTRWRLSTPCRRGPWRSRSAGRFPDRESLSSSAWCTPLPASAPVCRSWSRNVERSSSRPDSQMSVSKSRPRDLRQEDKKKVNFQV